MTIAGTWFGSWAGDWLGEFEGDTPDVAVASPGGGVRMVRGGPSVQSLMPVEIDRTEDDNDFLLFM